jgi:DNA-directed RNA polymerase subunit RPC12/RpoP
MSTVYHCTNCGHSFAEVSPSHWYPCASCGSHDCFREGDPRLGDMREVRRRGLTDYERLKLSWYHDEKKWVENIRGRKIIKQGHRQVVVLTDRHGNVRGRMPEPRDL